MFENFFETPHIEHSRGNQSEDPGYRHTSTLCGDPTAPCWWGIYQERRQKPWSQDKAVNSQQRDMCASYSRATQGQHGWLIICGLPRDHLCSSTLGNRTQVEYLKFCLHLLTLMVNPGTTRLLTFAQRCSSRDRWHHRQLGGGRWHIGLSLLLSVTNIWESEAKGAKLFSGSEVSSQGQLAPLLSA